MRGDDDSVKGPILLIVLFGLVYCLVSRVVLHAFPFSGDEYSCLLQAELFARGLLRAPAPPHADLLRVDHVVMDSWVRTKYPPGTSALLALGVRAGAPWVVTPIEGVVALVATWRTARAHFGGRPATISLVVMGASPLFAFQAASFFGHTPTTMWLALAFAGISLWLRTGASAWPLLAGGAIGCAFLTRPLDAVLFAAALVVFRSWRLIAMVAVGAAPFWIAHLGYQAAQFGGPFADGYHAYERTFREIYAQGNPLSLRYVLTPLQQANHLDQLRSLVQDWTVPGTVLVAVIGARVVAREHPARAMRNFAIAAAAIPTILLVVAVGDPDDGARPRYLSTTLLSMAFLAGPGWSATSTSLRALLGPRLAKMTTATALFMAPVQLGTFLAYRIQEMWVREGLFEAVRARQIDEGVVIVRAEWPTRYARNGPFFDRPVLYLSPAADVTVSAVAELYPGRAVYEATEGRHWTIVRRD
jgi:hypothetical protein